MTNAENQKPEQALQNEPRRQATPRSMLIMNFGDKKKWMQVFRNSSLINRRFGTVNRNAMMLCQTNIESEP